MPYPSQRDDEAVWGLASNNGDGTASFSANLPSAIVLAGLSDTVPLAQIEADLSELGLRPEADLSRAAVGTPVRLLGPRHEATNPGA